MAQFGKSRSKGQKKKQQTRFQTSFTGSVLGIKGKGIAPGGLSIRGIINYKFILKWNFNNFIMQEQMIPQEQYQSVPVSSDELYANAVQEDKIKNIISQLDPENQLKEIEKKYLGKKGELTQVLRSLKDLSVDEKKNIGKESNILKNVLQELVNNKNFKEESKKDFFDVTIPSQKIKIGHLHPLTLVRRENRRYIWEIRV